MFKQLLGAAAVVTTLLLMAIPARADNAVLEWNQIAFATTVTAAQGPLPQVRSMAIVHVSLHDAVNAITCHYRTYLPIDCGRPGSPEAAAIAAAHRALVGLFPAQALALGAARAASLASRGLTEGDPGITVGEGVAAQILAIRSSDGAAQAQFPYTAPGSGDAGVWVAASPAPALLPGWGNVSLWVLNNLSQFQPNGPPALHSKRYARDVNEVREIGSLTSQTRTAEQTEIARFWLATPTAIWNGVARQVMQARGVNLSESAQAMALIYLASADASIACWSAKYSFNFWRPASAIRNADVDDNAGTDADPAWTPLFPTPPHPEYLSGHATNSSAMASAMMLLFGDEPGAPIIATSPTNPGFERHWARLSEGVDEVIEARIYSGIHYRSADEEGAEVGRKIARFVVSHALRARHDN